MILEFFFHICLHRCEKTNLEKNFSLVSQEFLYILYINNFYFILEIVMFFRDCEINPFLFMFLILSFAESK